MLQQLQESWCSRGCRVYKMWREHKMLLRLNCLLRWFYSMLRLFSMCCMRKGWFLLQGWVIEKQSAERILMPEDIVPNGTVSFYACDLCHFIKWFRKAAIWCHLCDCQKAHCRVNSSAWYCQVCFEVHQVCQVLFRHGAEVRVLRYLQGGNSEGGGCRSEQWQIPLLDWHPNTSKYPLQWDDKFFHISDWRWYIFYF